MATQYGFRLFRVSLRRGMGRTDIPFEQGYLDVKKKAGAVLDEIVTTLDSIKGQTATEVLRYVSREAPSAETEMDDGLGEKEDTVPFIRLVSYSRYGQRVDLTFRFGRKGSHDLAIAADEENDADLGERSPSNEFRAFLYLPHVGTHALLVCEARNTICPASDLLRLIGVSMKDLNEEDGSGWWRLMPEPMTDGEHLKKFIRDGKAKGVRLLKKVGGTDGGREDTITLRQNGVPAEKFKQLKTTVGGWIGFSDVEVAGSRDSLEGDDAAAQIAALIDITVKADDFDEAGVEWEGPDGSTRFVKPSDVTDVFTYRVGSRGRRPTADVIRRTAESTFLPLLTNAKIELEVGQ